MSAARSGSGARIVGAARHNGRVSIAWATVAAPAPIGALTLGVSTAGVVHVGFGAGRARLAAVAARLREPLEVDAARTAPAAGRLAEYLDGRRRAFDLPLDWRPVTGSTLRVLRTLQAEVPFGATTTYGELARRSGLAGADAARGVGSIMGANPLPLLVPCHRVLAAGGLGGFGGGRAVKEWLLALEGVLTPALDVDV